MNWIKALWQTGRIPLVLPDTTGQQVFVPPNLIFDVIKSTDLLHLDQIFSSDTLLPFSAKYF